MYVINCYCEIGGNVFIVVYGNIICNIVYEFELFMDEVVILDNVSVIVLVYENGLFKLECLNDIFYFKKV